jgi:hypothetical protein
VTLIFKQLFLTILVSMLSTTFSTIVANATAEIQFRRAVLTLEGVKSDAIFSYLPPFNILALLTLLPLKLMITPRWFHKINVAAVRTLNAPLLLVIGLIERRTLWAGTRPQKDGEQLPKVPPAKWGVWDFSRGFSVHGDLQAVFDAEPPEEIEEEIEADDDLNRPSIERGHNALSKGLGKKDGDKDKKEHADPDEDGKDDIPTLKRTMTGRSRRDSVMPFAGMSKQIRDMLIESSDSEEEGGGVKVRLDALEKSSARIEEMLARLCQGFDDEPKGSAGSSVEGATGTMYDLDRSGTADLDE